MKITKFTHSCLLAETPETSVLFDPGDWSWQSGSFDINKIARIDYIVVTHEHADHFYPEFVQTVLKKFPAAQIVANDRVTHVMQEAGIKATFTGIETDQIKPFESPHEELPIPGLPPPEATGFHFADTLTHPGDCYSFAESKDILALPVIAPWGATGDAIKVALNLKPKHIIPIHDWHHSPEGRKWLYGLLDSVFSKESITFHAVQDGVPIEI